MEPKFKHGDICTIKTSGQKVMVIEYKINKAGNVVNFFKGRKEYDENVITDEVLCEWEINGKVVRQYVKEANLELVKD